MLLILRCLDNYSMFVQRVLYMSFHATNSNMYMYMFTLICVF